MSAPRPTIALIGHTGRMGALFADRLSRAGYLVRGLDLPAPADPPTGHLRPENSLDPTACAQALDEAGVVLLCVPVSAYHAVLESLEPSLRPDHLLMDIGSVKLLPLQWMEAAHPGPVVGAHPLFGPEPAEADNPTVALTPGRHAGTAALDTARALFQAAGFAAFTTTAEQHDRAVAYVQCLNFLSSAAYFAAVPRNQDILPFLTPSFRRRLAEQRKLLTEDAPMFQTFTQANPLTGEVLNHFQALLREAEHNGLEHLATSAAEWYRE